MDCVKEVFNASPITAVSTLLVIFFGILYFVLKSRNLPPGPTGLPLVGFWPFLKDKDVHHHLTSLIEKYGDVYSFNIAGQLFIHLGSIKSIKEAHVAKADCFSDRHDLYSFFTIIFGPGLGGTNGEEWKTLRKFFVQAFREYGLTSVKGYLTGPIYDAVNASVETLKATKGSPINIIPILNQRSSEILRLMMFNDGEITDEELNGIIECYQNALSVIFGKRILLMGNFARYFIFPRLSGYKFAQENHIKMRDYLTALVERHEATYTEGVVRDIVDSYIKERRERTKKGDPTARYFAEEMLVYTLIQFVGDGILGVAIFIAYFLNALLDYPEQQEIIYKELIDVVGENPQITLDHKNKLPYMNAFIQEVMRTTDFFTIFPSLLCTKDTTLNGQRIPKGSITMMNLWAAQHDPKVFEEPEKFKPSRYINEPGKPKLETPILFGVGKRSCAGEPFTMMQIFLFLTNIIRNFQLQRPEGTEKDSFRDGVIEICAYPRK